MKKKKLDKQDLSMWILVIIWIIAGLTSIYRNINSEDFYIITDQTGDVCAVIEK